ncbi:ABC transporter ATP-binding protein [Paenibacillus sp. CAA11]|uniref:ABC transporter ATP-binding protein n=1 Tax=Paenibacillus sp. CAA11 TaxID=1532905 RepID=UPI000D3CB923|nr:ABC transporter ATP-binding protein [Paenibacillus sp. CAA11]AWB46014.1 ABC transporter ATP-binding protein [Paenibacillus sp. CAA11]
MQSAITMEHVYKEYKGVRAVSDLSLDIGQGSVTALLGPNGAGKTTAISLMLGLAQPTQGRIRVLGASPLDRGVHQHLGAMLQDISVVDRLKVGETIDLFRSYYAQPLPLEQLLVLSGLQDVKAKYASSLSGGQKRRLDFALALAGDPKLLFLDEPTVGMDITSRELFWDTIRQLKKEGRTIVLTTHYLEEADQLADRILVINQGRLIADGSPAEIKASQGSRAVSFTAGPDVDAESLEELPGVLHAEWDGRRVSLFSQDTDRLIYALVRSELDIRDIDIQSGGLAGAFRSLIQGDDRP